jgi:hypothetical protein
LSIFDFLKMKFAKGVKKVVYEHSALKPKKSVKKLAA